MIELLQERLESYRVSDSVHQEQALKEILERIGFRVPVSGFR